MTKKAGSTEEIHALSIETMEDDFEDDGIDLSEMARVLLSNWKLVTIGTFVAGTLGAAISLLIPPEFTARTLLMPPQQQQSSTAAALSSLGALAGIAGGTGGLKAPADQYVALMQSTRVADDIIKEFKLMEVYEVDLHMDARKILSTRTAITSGKKDGLITVEVEDREPTRAAAIANAYVSSLRRLITSLAITEAQQRRVFFEQKLAETKVQLTQAQIALQASGFNAGALKTEPKAAAEGYAKLRAETTAANIKLQSMRGALTDNAPEIQQQRALASALQAELARIEIREAPEPGHKYDQADYITKFRDYKYQETLFDLFARQYEAARVDESREGTLIQVIDPATPPERKTKPKRASIAIAFAIAAASLMCTIILFRHMRRRVSAT